MEEIIDTPEYLQAALVKLDACDESREWANGKTYTEAWDSCDNSEWLLWLLAETDNLSPITNELLICRFAREALHLTTDPRVLACIEVREAWIIGKATDEERKAARDAAEAAVDAAGDAARIDVKAKQCNIIRELCPRPIL